MPPLFLENQLCKEGQFKKGREKKAPKGYLISLEPSYQILQKEPPHKSA
jgi:hypothetical protein